MRPPSVKGRKGVDKIFQVHPVAHPGGGFSLPADCAPPRPALDLVHHRAAPLAAHSVNAVWRASLCEEGDAYVQSKPYANLQTHRISVQAESGDDNK